MKIIIKSKPKSEEEKKKKKKERKATKKKKNWAGTQRNSNERTYLQFPHDSYVIKPERPHSSLGLKAGSLTSFLFSLVLKS